MKVLITGAGGWLGSELTEQLLIKGNEITALNLGKSEKLSKLKEIYKEKLTIIDSNITDYKVLEEAIKGQEYVYHLAARVHFIPTSEEERAEFYKLNTEASNKLFDLSLKYNVKKVIFYSTVAVYEESNDLITTKSKKAPTTPYGDSKLKAEEYGLKLYKEKGLPITIIEPVTVYGGDDVGNFKKLEKLINKGISVIFGDGNNKKTVIYYKDLITMTINIANDSDADGKVFICGTENISLNDINNVLINACGRKVFKVRINKYLIKTMITLLKLIPIKPFKKISRQITVLTKNNIYNVKEVAKYCNKHTTFKENFIGE